MDDAEEVLQAANDDTATEVQAAIRHIDHAERRTSIRNNIRSKTKEPYKYIQFTSVFHTKRKTAFLLFFHPPCVPATAAAIRAADDAVIGDCS